MGRNANGSNANGLACSLTAYAGGVDLMMNRIASSYATPTVWHTVYICVQADPDAVNTPLQQRTGLPLQHEL